MRRIHTKKRYYVVGLVVLIVTISFFLQQSEIEFVDEASNYTFGTVVSLTADSDVSTLGATAQIAALGEIPIIRIRNMTITNCSSATAYISKTIDTNNYQSNIAIGKVQFFSGNTNYRVPYGTNISNYPYLIIFCDSTKTQLAHAYFQ